MSVVAMGLKALRTVNSWAHVRHTVLPATLGEHGDDTFRGDAGGTR